ncbi:hypothetical protein J6590_035921 [Homalodisca vitripennis]|nr:hypothetical protein J6590_035921 [Homalodisca vitripennis]
MYQKTVWIGTINEKKREEIGMMYSPRLFCFDLESFCNLDPKISAFGFYNHRLSQGIQQFVHINSCCDDWVGRNRGAVLSHYLGPYLIVQLYVIQSR